MSGQQLNVKHRAARMSNPCDLNIPGAQTALRSGALSASDLARAHLDRINERDRSVKAFVELDGELVLRQAAEADQRLSAGDADRYPLLGIPIAIKDIIDVAGSPTTCGSHSMTRNPATQDARLIQQLRDAGAIILGKVATYEFALTGPSFDQPTPPPRNPWNPDHITGGSSSGSAASVASGMVRCAIGSDTGGSIRSPSSYCGVVGLKPTFDRVSRDGVFPLSASLDHVGPLAATVADAAWCMDAMAEPNGAPAAASLIGHPVEQLTIGYARDWFAQDEAADPRVVRAMDDAVAQLSMLGCRIEMVGMPEYALAESIGTLILQAEALAVHQNALAKKADHYGKAARRNLITGAVLSEGDISAARIMAGRLRRAIEEATARFDAIVTVNTLTPAPPFEAFASGDPVWTPMRTIPFNISGHPALAIPIGFADGLPLGMQIVGRHFDEARLCQIGHSFERSTDHAAQTPPAWS